MPLSTPILARNGLSGVIKWARPTLPTLNRGTTSWSLESILRTLLLVDPSSLLQQLRAGYIDPLLLSCSTIHCRSYPTFPGCDTACDTAPQTKFAAPNPLPTPNALPSILNLSGFFYILFAA